MFWAQLTIQTKVLRQEGNTVSEATVLPHGLVSKTANTFIFSPLGESFWKALLLSNCMSGNSALQKSCPDKGDAQAHN